MIDPDDYPNSSNSKLDGEKPSSFFLTLAVVITVIGSLILLG